MAWYAQTEFNGDKCAESRIYKVCINLCQILIPNMFSLRMLNWEALRSPFLQLSLISCTSTFCVCVCMWFKTVCVCQVSFLLQNSQIISEVTVSIYLHPVFRAKRGAGLWKYLRVGEEQTNLVQKANLSILPICVFLITSGNEIICMLPLSEEKWPWFSLSPSQSIQKQCTAELCCIHLLVKFVIIWIYFRASE